MSTSPVEEGPSLAACGSGSGLPVDDQRSIAAGLGIPYAESLAGRTVPPEFLERVSIQFARSAGVIALESPDNPDSLDLAVCDLSQLDEIDGVRRILSRPAELLFAPSPEVSAAITSAYESRSGETEALIDSLDAGSILSELSELGAREDLLETDSRAPVIKLVNLILSEAVKLGASDVHLQPYEHRVFVRMRIDGVLFDLFEVPKELQSEIASRVKIVAHMNIAEKRVAQDGRATVRVGERVVDLRISSVPSTHGERIVIRLLDKSARLYTLEEVGMAERELRRFREIARSEHGLILVTGPTGSGKSTSLYATLGEINAKEKNIITLEDPVEYSLDGISQIQVSDRKGMTFASGLRSVLRQDPDIVMVGEIRDEETAVMAIQSALTGHLVFSTLHTNDAASAVTRLLDLGIEPYLVASSVIGVLAQRLVRRVCVDCAEEIGPGDTGLVQAGLPEDALIGGTPRRGRGCANCRSTGYRGRTGLFELLAIDDDLRRGIQARDTAAELHRVASKRGMRRLAADGIDKIRAGITTVDEVARVTIRQEV